jgi:hypothetical protein
MIRQQCNRQIVIVTHNDNIVVNADSEYVIAPNAINGLSHITHYNRWAYPKVGESNFVLILSTPKYAAMAAFVKNNPH